MRRKREEVSEAATWLYLRAKCLPKEAQWTHFVIAYISEKDCFALSLSLHSFWLNRSVTMATKIDLCNVSDAL